MGAFRMRLIVALIAGITVVSLASTYFEVLAHKHVLRREMERRTAWIGTSLQPDLEQALTAGQTSKIAAWATQLRIRDEALGLAVYDVHGGLMAADVPAEILKTLSINPVKQAIKRGLNSGLFGHTGDVDWLEEAVPLHVNVSRPVHWSFLKTPAIFALRALQFGSTRLGGFWRLWC